MKFFSNRFNNYFCGSQNYEPYYMVMVASPKSVFNLLRWHTINSFSWYHLWIDLEFSR